MPRIRILNRSPNPLPRYATGHSAGMDICAWLEEPVTLHPMERKLIPTGLYIELPHEFEAQIRPRSGLAINHGFTLLNTPGTIDSDYRGEIRIIVINLGEKDFTVHNGDRIAQMIVKRFERIDWEEVEVVSETERGAGGFGHSGL